MSWSSRKCGFTTFAVFLVLMLVLLCLQHENIGQWQKNKENMMSKWTLSDTEGKAPCFGTMLHLYVPMVSHTRIRLPRDGTTTDP